MEEPPNVRLPFPLSRYALTLCLILSVSACTAAENRTGAPDNARRGTLPDGFALDIGNIGCDPEEQCDDVGPPVAIRNQFVAQSGDNYGHWGIGWGETQPEDPIDGEAVYDFSKVKPDPLEVGKKYVSCYLHHFGNPWAEEFRFSDIDRYNKHLERWAEAAARFARETYGTTIFQAGGNERDLVAKDQYQPHFPDWHFFYMDPVKAIHRGMKKAHPDNKLMIGNLCYNDRDHIGALYAAGAKGHFEILNIHAYGPRGVHVDMEQILESRQEMEYHGDHHIPIYLTEGWSSFPLPDSVNPDLNPIWRQGGRPYTPEEVEHYRQTVLDGWRNLITPRPEYDPKWVFGASYFVLNDHWGGKYWEGRARAEYDDNGNLRGFHLDGYFIGTSDPNWIKPLVRPWGLIDVYGEPKGDIVFEFPPYLPKHTITAELSETLDITGYDPNRPEKTTPYVVTDTVYHATVFFQNDEDQPMTDLVFLCGDKSDADYPAGNAFENIAGQVQPAINASNQRRIRVTRTSPEPPKSLLPGESVTLTYELVFPSSVNWEEALGWKKRMRPYADVYYRWDGRIYHTDAWLPRVTVKSN